MLALFAELVRPEVRALPDAALQELEAMPTRRRQLLEMLHAERNCLGQVFGRGTHAVERSIRSHIAFLERQLRASDTELHELVKASPVCRERGVLFRSVPGVALMLPAELPELGASRGER